MPIISLELSFKVLSEGFLKRGNHFALIVLMITS